MLDGFRYLEERDASDKITRAGVVSKKSAFVSPDNAGIYDAIALDLRLLAEAATSLADDADLQQILTQVKSMYNDMRTNPNFGSTAARAAAEDALKQAQAAAASAKSAKQYGDKAASVASAITAVENYLKTIDALQNSTADNATVATNKANSASTSANSAKTSETNAKNSETNSKTSETNAATSASDSATSATASANSAKAAADSASQAKTSETNAKTSETNSKASETNASSSAASSATSAKSSSDSMNMSKAWAVSTTSPDNAVDSNSSTGKTQSSRTWALYSKDRATAAKASENAAKASATSASTNAAKMQDVINNAVTTLQQALNGENKAYMCTDDISYPIAQIDDNGTIYPMDIVVVSEGEPASGTEVWIDI